MSIVKNAAAIAKGMSITFGQLFQPTEVENYPDGEHRGKRISPAGRYAKVYNIDYNPCIFCGY